MGQTKLVLSKHSIIAHAFSSKTEDLGLKAFPGLNMLLNELSKSYKMHLLKVMWALKLIGHAFI